MQQTEMRQKLWEIANSQEEKKKGKVRNKDVTSKNATSAKPQGFAGVIIKLITSLLKLITGFFTLAIGLLLAIAKMWMGFFFR